MIKKMENNFETVPKNIDMGKTKEGLVWQLRPTDTLFEGSRFMPLGGYGNGYVGLPKGHPYYGVTYEEIPVDVYGGLTFSEQKGEYWVVGFDVFHYGQNLNSWPKDRCMKELMSLVEQLHPGKAEITALLEEVTDE
jgi:hypothetical protein